MHCLAAAHMVFAPHHLSLSKPSFLPAGYFGIQQAECEARSCCWQPAQVANTPWCFEPQQPAGATYTVAERNGTGALTWPLLASCVMACGLVFPRLQCTWNTSVFLQWVD